jgi:hypothetical protein
MRIPFIAKVDNPDLLIRPELETFIRETKGGGSFLMGGAVFWLVGALLSYAAPQATIAWVIYGGLSVPILAIGPRRVALGPDPASRGAVVDGRVIGSELPELADGRVPIDNNETEQLMKQVATGRKNWLFIGSVEAGYRAAILLTIVSTAHRYHLDLWLYVKDVLDRLLRADADLDSLRADRWAKSHPEAIRPYRVEEARYRADAKTTRRTRRRLLELQRSSRK